LEGVISAADLLHRLDLACRQPDPEAPPWRELSGLQPRFRPVLHLRKRLVSAYRLVAASPAGDGAGQREADCSDELDVWALQWAAETLREPRRRSKPALIVPVHYPSLASRRPRDLLMQACRELPPRSSRQLVFELLALPTELPQARVRELMAYLRPFCLAILVRLPRPEAGIAQLAGTGVRGVAVALPAETDPAGAMAPALTTLAGAARISGLRSMLVDLDDPRLCRWAAAAGIDHVCGDGLMPPLRRPGRAFVVA
jgi:hypothetical protein